MARYQKRRWIVKLSCIIVPLILNTVVAVGAEFGLQSFTCTYLEFRVTYDVVPTRLILIDSLVVNCSNGGQLYEIGDYTNLNYHVEGLHDLLYLLSPPVEELSQCFLSGSYQDINSNFKEKTFQSTLSCTLPKTNVSVVPPQLTINSSTSTNISCSVKSSTYVSIKWLKKGSLLKENSNLSITQTVFNESPYHLLTVSTLRFSSAQQSDSECYECISTGPILNGTSQVSSAAGCLEVSGPEEEIITSTALHEAISTNTDGVAGNDQSNTLYRIIAALASALAIFASCTVILTMYCLWLRATRKNKLSMHAFAVIYPTASELNDFDIESMKVPGLKVLSESTPSLLATLNSSDPINETNKADTHNSISHILTS